MSFTDEGQHTTHKEGQEALENNHDDAQENEPVSKDLASLSDKQGQGERENNPGQDGQPVSEDLTNLSDLLDNELQRNPLPHYCVYITWVLLLVTMAVCAFFLILYSMQWGRTTSAEWLASFLLSFLESFFILDPIKVS